MWTNLSSDEKFLCYVKCGSILMAAAFCEWIFSVLRIISRTDTGIWNVNCYCSQDTGRVHPETGHEGAGGDSGITVIFI